MVTRCGCSNAADGLPSDAAAMLCREPRCVSHRGSPFFCRPDETQSPVSKFRWDWLLRWLLWRKALSSTKHFAGEHDDAQSSQSSGLEGEWPTRNTPNRSTPFAGRPLGLGMG